MLIWLLDNKPKTWLASNQAAWDLIGKCLAYYNNALAPHIMYRRLRDFARLSQLYATDSAAAATGDALQGLRPKELRDWFDAAGGNSIFLMFCCCKLEQEAPGDAARDELYHSPEFWGILLTYMVGLVYNLYKQRTLQLQQPTSSNQRSSSSRRSNGTRDCRDGHSTSSSSRGRRDCAGSSAQNTVCASSLAELVLPPDHLEVAVAVAVAGGKRAVEAQIAIIENCLVGKAPVPAATRQREGLSLGGKLPVYCLLCRMFSALFSLHPPPAAPPAVATP